MVSENSFEQGLKNLEKIVEILENGDLPLKESIEKFEEGMKIVDECNKRLEKAEQRIKKIVNVNGKISKEPLDESINNV